MKIFLTGSAGFLGTRVLPLLAKHHQVTCFKGDLLKPQTIPDFDCIVHLAARVPKTKQEDTKDLYEQNIRMCKNLPPTRIIFASTVEAFTPNTWYGKSKLASEKLFPNTTILRFSVMYGPGDHIDRAIPNFVTAAIRGDNITITGASNKRDYLHVDDAARAILLAVKYQPRGIFFIGTGHAVTIRDAARAIAPEAKIKEKSAPKHDLLFDTKKAAKALKFQAKYRFPDRISELIPRPIVFDLDGTILDVSKKYAAIPKEQFKKLIETPKYLALDTIYPEMEDILQYLYGKYPLYLVTMRKNRKNLLSQLEALGLNQFFPDTRVINPKDKIKAVKKIKPALVIGDTQLDIQAAQAAGAKSILVPYRKNLHAIIEKIYAQSVDHHPRVQ